MFLALPPPTPGLLQCHGHDPHALVQIVRELQAQHGWLPRQALGEVALGLGAAACNPLRDTIAKFRPAYERHLKSLCFEPGFDLDAELSIARHMTGRDDPGAPLEAPE